MEPTRTPNTPGESGRSGNTNPSSTGGQYGRPELSGTAGVPPRTPPAGSTGGSGNMGKSQDQGAVDKAKDAASGVMNQAKDAASSVVDKAQETVQPQVDSQKERAAQQLGGLADAVRQTSQQLHQKDQHGLADVVGKSAQRVDRLAGYLRERDIGELVDDVERYSRREPAMFIGGALALGFIAARFLKSSREKAYQSRAGSSYPIGRSLDDTSPYGLSGYPGSGAYPGSSASGYRGAGRQERMTE